MARSHSPTKYGAAYSTEVFSCSRGHVHLVGLSEDDEMEYEIVLGERLIQLVEECIQEVRDDAAKKREATPSDEGRSSGQVHDRDTQEGGARIFPLRPRRQTPEG